MSAISDCGKDLVGSEDIYTKLNILREKCVNCFCIEISDFEPREVNVKISSELMKSRGNPQCIKEAPAKIKIKI